MIDEEQADKLVDVLLGQSTLEMIDFALGLTATGLQETHTFCSSMNRVIQTERKSEAWLLDRLNAQLGILLCLSRRRSALVTGEPTDEEASAFSSFVTAAFASDDEVPTTAAEGRPSNVEEWAKDTLRGASAPSAAVQQQVSPVDPLLASKADGSRAQLTVADWLQNLPLRRAGRRPSSHVSRPDR